MREEDIWNKIEADRRGDNGRSYEASPPKAEGREVVNDRLVFVDCEGHGSAASLNNHEAFEFGAVHYATRKAFHGKGGSKETFEAFEKWIMEVCPAPQPRRGSDYHPIDDNRDPQYAVFVSDNPAYDWQFINFYFHYYLRRNPFGHSARRISDFYAGLVGNWSRTQEWKKWRKTPHDHNPVHDALGNVEAFEEIMKLMKGEKIDGPRPV